MKPMRPTQSIVPISYSPVMPLQPSWTSVMSQDIITTDTIPVDSISPTPVAAFTNPSGGGQAGNAQPEALVVAKLSQASEANPQLCHVARNPRTDGGWSLIPLFGGRTANEVAAGTAYTGSSNPMSFGFFNDDSGLYSTQLQSDGATWSDPQTILQGSISNLKVAYSPAGRMVLYGSTPQGDLATAYQQQVGGPFVSTVCAMQGGLTQGGFHLCMTDETNWTVAANVNGQPWIYTGLIGAGEYSAVDQVSQFLGTLNQVVLGYWNDMQNTLMFLLVDSDNALHVWAMNAASSTTVVQPIPNSTVTAATGHVSSDQTLHVYTIDDKMNLWVLHQDKDNPWNDDGTPNWSPYIPLDTQVARVASDTNPADAPNLFACAAADYSLRLHAQDPLTRMWRSGPVLQDSEDVFEIVRFRTEVSLLDANGLPASGYPLTVTAAPGNSATEIWVAGNTYAVDSQTSVPLTTDATGKLTLAVLTTAGMVTPKLLLSAEGLPAPLTIQPAAPVHNYLAGQGPLNLVNPGGPLPVFDAGGNTLKAAQVNGQLLAPGASGPLAGVAASAIQNTALVGLDKPPSGIVGYSFSLSGNQPRFTLHRTREEFDVYLATMSESKEAGLGSIWDDIGKWAGDVWEGIKNGLIQISNVLVDVGSKIANFTAHIGDMIVSGIKLAVKGLEQAAHFIAGVFKAVEAELAKVIDWMKAMFDFAAIWRTKMVFEEGLLALPGYLHTLFQLAENASDKWFANKKQQVDQAFANVESAFIGKSFSDLPNWQQPGQPPDNQTEIAGNATPADFTSNVHHNWLQDKISSGTPDNLGLGPDQPLQEFWSDTFEPKLMSSVQDFIEALKDFKDAVTVTIQQPKEFGSVGIPDFLKAVNKLADSALTLCDLIVDTFALLGQKAMDALGNLLKTELNLGFLNKLWKWIADSAGYPSDSTLTRSRSALSARCLSHNLGVQAYRRRPH